MIWLGINQGLMFNWIIKDSLQYFEQFNFVEVFLQIISI